jgi:glutaredoxin
MVKVYLSRAGVPFREHNVSSDREGLKLLLSLGCRTTPVTLVAGEKIIGYNPSRIAAALQSAGITSG